MEQCKHLSVFIRQIENIPRVLLKWDNKYLSLLLKGRALTCKAHSHQLKNHIPYPLFYIEYHTDLMLLALALLK